MPYKDPEVAREKARNRYYKNRKRHLENKSLYRAVNREKCCERIRRCLIISRYGITLEQKAEMFEAQGGLCAICGKLPKRAHIDHDHTTGKVRGILCSGCNTKLFALETYEWRIMAEQYLAKHRPREAGIMLLVKDGLILGITRRTDRTKYGLPGGKFDPSEGDKTVMETAIRETYEETGVEVHSCVEIYERIELGDSPSGENFYSTCFYATEWSGEPHDSEEGVVEWLTERDLTGDKGAFADYNMRTLAVFKTKFPNVKIEL